ncbi:unnamed protein product, partial [Brassica rapa subsp. narinosa]
MLPLHRTEPSTGSSSAYGTRPLSPSVGAYQIGPCSNKEQC